MKGPSAMGSPFVVVDRALFFSLDDNQRTHNLALALVVERSVVARVVQHTVLLAPKSRRTATIEIQSLGHPKPLANIGKLLNRRTLRTTLGTAVDNNEKDLALGIAAHSATRMTTKEERNLALQRLLLRGGYVGVALSLAVVNQHRTARYNIRLPRGNRKLRAYYARI